MNRLSCIIKSKLFSNMSWLFVVNAVNSLIPYLILPYITQRFGPALYGRFSFSITFIGYFSTLIEFGFDLTSARAIATSKTDDEINTIFSTTFVCRIILFLASIPFILISIFSFKKVNECSTELLIMIILLFSNTIMTTWFYHGKQIMKHISIISVVIRSTYTILVFLLVKSQNEYFLYVVIYVIAALLISSIALQIAHQRFNLSFRKVSFRQICDRYKEAFFVFISNCTISLTSTAGVLIAGFLYTFENVGYYSTMEKISTVITMTYIPIGQALYPETSRRFVNSFASGVAYVKKIAKYIIPLYSIGCAALMVFRKPVIRVVFGEQYLIGEDLLLLLLFIPVLSICSNLIGTQVLLASGRNRDYGKAFAIGSAFSVLFYVVFVYFFHSRGIVIAMISWEVLTILLMLLYSKRALSTKKESRETINSGFNQ